MDEKAVDNTESGTLWQRLNSSWQGIWSTTLGKIGVYLLGFGILMLVVFALYQSVPAGEDPGAAIDYPKDWSFGSEVMRAIDDVVDWIIVKGDAFFDGINTVVLQGVLLPLKKYFLWLPWWSIILVTGTLAWFTSGRRIAIMSTIFLSLMTIMGFLDRANETMAITITSTFICIIFGLPIGIIASRSDRFEGILRPVLDMMQTMPSFVYLVPALMLFGLGSVPAVMATCIYAIPPIVRLTNLGIRQVDTQVVEASRSFGTTPSQLLIKVQVPMALPTILAGMNQTIMMALAMVVLASMIGAGGLGAEILIAISRIEVGRGVLAGLSIVFMAMILDRITQGFASRPEPRRAT